MNYDETNHIAYPQTVNVRAVLKALAERARILEEMKRFGITDDHVIGQALSEKIGKIAMIKLVRETFGWGLKDCKDFVEEFDRLFITK